MECVMLVQTRREMSVHAASDCYLLQVTAKDLRGTVMNLLETKATLNTQMLSKVKCAPNLLERFFSVAA